MLLELVTLLFSIVQALGVDCENACHPNETCCPGPYASEPNCCPYKNAVCCVGGTHCCPEGSFCDLDVGMCGVFVQPQMSRDVEEKMTPVTSEDSHLWERIDKFEEEMTTDPNESLHELQKRIGGNAEEMNLDTNESSDEEQKMIDQFIEGIITNSNDSLREMQKLFDKFKEAMITAQSKKYHEVPKRIGDTAGEMITDPNESRDEAQKMISKIIDGMIADRHESDHVKRDTDFEHLKNEISGVNQMLVHCDLTQYCPFFYTCCPSEDPEFFLCCPNAEAVCCPGGNKCCRRGEQCDSRGIFCISEVGMDTEVREADTTLIRYTKHDLNFEETIQPYLKPIHPEE